MASKRNADFYINQIEGLLKLASDPNATSSERENAQDKADALMFRYRIDRALLFKEDASEAREVLIREYSSAASEEFVGVANHMRANVFIHMGCMVNERYHKLTVVGYQEEIRMAEMLWAQIFLNFTRTIFPKWETWKSFDANVYDLKVAGYSWPHVCKQGLDHGAGDAAGPLTQKNSGSKLRTAFKREAKRRGVIVPAGKQQPINPKKWRRSFADAYGVRLTQRLANLKVKNEAEADEKGMIALVSDQDRVKQQFYALFPDLNPEVQKRRREEALEAEEARRAALTPEQRIAEDIRNEKEDLKWYRRARKASPFYDDSGWVAGLRAADKADLGQEKISSTSGKELN